MSASSNAAFREFRVGAVRVSSEGNIEPNVLAFLARSSSAAARAAISYVINGCKRSPVVVICATITEPSEGSTD
jgi:hypothetical protein